MNPLRQAAIIFSVCLLGELASRLLPVPIPGSVLAMIFLFILLLTGIVKEKSIKDVTDFFLNNMAFFFIPTGVGILEYISVLKPVVLPFLIICLASTLAAFGATALTVQLVSSIQNKIRGGKTNE